MSAIDPRDLRIGDLLRLRKPHACGGEEWEVMRLGTDIGLRCRRCGRRVLIERDVIERRVAAVLQRGEGPTADEIVQRTHGSA